MAAKLNLRCRRREKVHLPPIYIIQRQEAVWGGGGGSVGGDKLSLLPLIAPLECRR